MKQRHWPWIVVRVVAGLTLCGALLADVVLPALAAQHAFNPGWPPHAKFHDAQYVVMTVLLGAAGLVLASRRRGEPHQQLLLAAAIVATPWLGMVAALAFPGTATHDPEFADRTLFVFGLHGQVSLAVVLLAALLAATIAAARSRDYPQPTANVDNSAR